MRLSDDCGNVEVTAKIAKSAASLMVEDAKFWVVRPRISLSGVSGLVDAAVGQLHRLRGGHVDEARTARSSGSTCRRSSPADRPGASSSCWQATSGRSASARRLLPAAAGRTGRRLRPRAGRQVGRDPHLRQRALRQVRQRGHALLERERRRRVADRERARRAHAIAGCAARRRHRVRDAARPYATRRRPCADTVFTLFADRVTAMKVDESIAHAVRLLLHGIGARPVRRRAGHLLRRSGRRSHRRRASRSIPKTLDVRPRVEVAALSRAHDRAAADRRRSATAQAMVKSTSSCGTTLMQKHGRAARLARAARDGQPASPASVTWRSSISRRSPKARSTGRATPPSCRR